MELLGIILLCALLAALILPWVNLVRLSGHRDELNRLQAELNQLKQAPNAQRAKAPVASQEEITPHPTNKELLKSTPPPIPAAASVKETVVSKPLPKEIEEVGVATGVNPVTHPKSEVPSESEEPQDWFSKIAVWVGGIALLMAGFYMVKYSIDSGWVTPMVRVCITAGFGVLLAASGGVIGVKAKLASTERIGQALSGAGVACLYFAVYAAVHLYHFLGVTGGFVGMVMVTLLAVALSLRNGAPIALMGLVGGFLTPLLMQTDATDTLLLFGYLFFLFCGAQYLCLRRGWLGLLLGSLIGVYLWSGFVILSNWNQPVQYLEGAMVFVIGICAVNAVWAVSMKSTACSQHARSVLSVIRIFAWSGGLFQSLALVWLSGFSGVDFTLFAVLSIGALTLAAFDEGSFFWAAWLALVAICTAILSSPVVGGASWLLWAVGLLGLFFVVGHWRALRSDKAVEWRALSMASVLLLTPLLYANRVWVVEWVTYFDGFWILLAGMCALCLMAAGEHIFRREDSTDVVGEYSAFAVFLFGFGLWTYLPSEYLAHGIAGLWIVGLLYWNARKLGRMHLMQGVLGGVWSFLVFASAVKAVSYFLREPLHGGIEQTGFVALAWLLGVVALAGSTYFSRKDEQIVALLKWALGLASLFSLVVTYQWLDESHMSDAWSRVLVEGGLTALLAVLAVSMCRFVTRYRRGIAGSYILSALVCLRVVVLHLGDQGAEGENFFFNALLLQFGVPFLAASAMAWMWAEVQHQAARHAHQVIAMLIGFVWSTFLVQDYFGGSELFEWRASNTEVYTYSVVWLVLAVLYQSIGLWRNQRMIHAGSLALLLLTIGKVFLVDASELEGIFRVFSFLGLGVALIGIGFFYNKVVFARQNPKTDHT
ncbi:MAG: DUF2339 domain-containing protein [Opitutaceae bacterium]